MTLAYAVLLVGYIARPLGGLLFGHFGDRFGRKNVLFITLMGMGLVSIGIGLLPTYEHIGIAAPLTLVFLRLVQGLAVGGEWAGATLMAMEHSSAKKRGLGASIAVTGGPAGSVLATLMLAAFSTLPREQFMSWGWRIPFLLSAVIVIIGLYLRVRVTESPDFERAQQLEKAKDVHDHVIPLWTVLTKYPKEVVLGALAGSASLFIQGLLAVFMVPYVVKQGGIDQSTALWLLTFSSFLHIFTIPFFASLSDRFGRKPVMLFGAVFSIVMIWPMFALFNSQNVALIGLAFILGNPIIQASMYGPIGAFLSEKFATKARYTGASLSFQLSSVIGAGTAALVAQNLVTPEAGTTKLAIYITVLFVVSGVAVLLSKETGRPTAKPAAMQADARLESGSK